MSGFSSEWIFPNMRFAVKMYAIMLVGGLVVLYQYHLSKAWIIPQANTEVIQEMYARKISETTKPNDSLKTEAFTKSCLDKPVSLNGKASLPPLYVITPTYKRAEQLAELTRLGHTLMLVPNVHWLVIEDAETKTPFVTELLKKTGLQFIHLTAPMPPQYKNKKKGPKPRGVSNRNKGIEWIRANAVDGVMYFADDDNTYDLEIFNEMRFTHRVSMWPVGLITKLGVSSPIVKNGEFSGFYDGWIAGRKFPVDMAGFAVAVKFLLQRPKASMPFKPGFEEDGFLRSLNPFEPQEIELLASNCTKILVWHTQTKKNEPSQALDIQKYGNTNIVMLKKILI